MPTPLPVKAALTGAAIANLAAPPAAALVATVYRFPLPLSGYAEGISRAVPAAIGSIFYLVLGGAVLLALLGAAGGLAAARFAGPDDNRVLAITIGVAVAFALLGAIALATLELFIGAW